MDSKSFTEAATIGYQLASTEKCVGNYLAIQSTIAQRYKNAGKPVPNNLQGSGFNVIAAQNEHSNAVRSKEAGIQGLMKQLNKDNLRKALLELGAFYSQAGFLQEAHQQWNKSLDLSNNDRDAFNMRY